MKKQRSSDKGRRAALASAGALLPSGALIFREKGRDPLRSFGRTDTPFSAFFSALFYATIFFFSPCFFPSFASFA
ncbi:MAG: hypothetical protein IJP03_06820 [Christensenellaceae bacterium]|nr:hypothetical protein [Christensenellaceae bacterium]